MSTRPAASTPSPYPLHTSSPACHCHCTTQTFTSLVRCLLQGQSQATAPHCLGSLSHVRPLLHPPTHASHLPAGCCFLVGGARYKTQSFSVAINKASCSLLFLAAIALVIPTAACSSLAGVVNLGAIRGPSLAQCGAVKLRCLSTMPVPKTLLNAA